jgi:hypothetical protein
VSVGAPSPPPATAPSVGGPGATSDAPAGDSCPLCGAPLDPDQDWCLHCGAAARTRLAASSSWKAPLIAAGVVAALALAVLAAALVKLVSDANRHVRNTVVLIQTPAPATPTTAAPTTTAPSPRTPAPAPAAPVALAPVTVLSSSAATLNGSVNPQGVPTTYQFHFRTTASSSWMPSNPPVNVGAGTGPVNVNARIAFLTPGTTYHYTLTGTKAGHPVTTPEATFTTLGKAGASTATPPPAQGRLSAPAKRRLAELEARLRASKFPSERQQLRLEEQRVLAGH